MANTSDDSEWQYAVTELLLGDDGAALERMVFSGHDINSRLVHGGTALMRAAAAGLSNTLRVLKLGGDPNIQDTDYGWTALMYAADCDSAGYCPLSEGADIVQALLAAGADPSLKNKAGETALDVAKKQQYTSTEHVKLEIVEVLQKAANL